MPARDNRPEWPAYNMVQRGLDDLTEPPREVRTYTDEDVAKAATMVQEYGWTLPILITPEGEIIAGVRRFRAAKLLNASGDLPYPELPCVVAEGWTDEQIRAYRIADNRMVQDGEWDAETLLAEFDFLEGAGFDLDLTGFEEFEIADMRDDAAEGEGDGEGGSASLMDRFVWVPFTVLSARDGRWQARKQAWHDIGIESELGCGAAPGGSRMPGVASDGSIERNEMAKESKATKHKGKRK